MTLVLKGLMHHLYSTINSTFPLHESKLLYGLLIVLRFCLSIHVGIVCIG